MTQAKSEAIAVIIPSTLTLTVTHEQLVQLALANRDLQLERTATGKLIVMAPTGVTTGNKNSDIEGQLWFWNRQTKLGKTFKLLRSLIVDWKKSTALLYQKSLVNSKIMP